MWKRLIEKFLCLHDWKLWAKQQDYHTHINTEILICKHCGKVKILKY